MLGLIDHWYLCDLPTQRAMSAKDIGQRLIELGFKEDKDHTIQTFTEPGLAYAAALEKAGEGDRMAVFGSFYTVSGVMAYRNAKAH